MSGALRATLFALALGLASPLVALQATEGADPEQTEDGRRTYLGREIARTMHWSGAEWLLRETRQDEENSALLFEQLGIEVGSTVCDLGCGNGYYTLPIAAKVGSGGKVYAVDIQREMLKLLTRRTGEAGLENVVPILGTVRDPKLPPASCDRVVAIDVYHEISHPVSVLTNLRTALKPEGRLILVEFRLEDPQVPIKKRHKMTKAQVLTEMAANGFVFASEFDGLPWQHVLVFGKDPDFRPERDTASETGTAVAAGLWRAVKNGDVLSLAGFYAEKLHVQAGSEFLKERWGGARTARSDGRTLRRDEWLARYAKALEELGRAAWREALAGGQPIVDTVSSDDGTGVRSGDLRLSIEGDLEGLSWFLRRNEVGQWHVIAERTDY